MLDSLKELGKKEDRAEHSKAHEQRDTVDDAEAAVRKESERQHRRRRDALPGNERRKKDRAGDEPGDHFFAAPADGPAPYQSENEAEEPGARQRHSHHVEAAPVAERLVEA